MSVISMGGTRKYLAMAALMGVAWYLALLIPRATRQFLFPGHLLTLGHPVALWLAAQQVIAVSIISVALAFIFKRAIVNWSDPWRAATLSVLLPLVGTVLYSLFLFVHGLFTSTQAQRSFGSALGELAVSTTYSVILVLTRAFYVVVPMGFLSQLVMNRSGRIDGRPIDKRFRIVLVIIVLLALPSAAWMQRLNGTRTVTREMSWTYGPPSGQYPASQHIVLTFTDYPEHSIGVYSRDLGRYLESLPSRQVPVTFEVSYDFGSVLGFHEVRIGALTHWDDEWSYYSVQGDKEKSPWPNP